GRDWTAATQLFATDDPLTFTAPHLQYLMDSPIELGDTELHSFTVGDGEGQRIRVALHHLGSDEIAARYVDDVERIVRESRAVFGEYPRFDAGEYTFIADYLPWADGDGMEHRNSTILTAPYGLERAYVGLLGTVAHEFFHAWNVERIRPASLEPFDFERANMSGELWLAEGFTSYYGNLLLHRAGVSGLDRLLDSLGGTINAVRRSPAVQLRSAVQMSRLAPFVDAARPVDATYWDNTFLSYYTFGAAIGLGLDLTLRDRSDGEITLDDYMRALWQRFGAPDAGSVDVGRAYTTADAAEVLAEVSGDPGFAREFFARHIEGNEAIDHGPLLLRAGLLVRPRRPQTPHVGMSVQRTEAGLEVTAPTTWGAPAYEAGIDLGDVVLQLDGRSLRSPDELYDAIGEHEPGDDVTLRIRRRGGEELTVSLTLAPNPIIEIVPVERTGEGLEPSQRAFREGWLGSRVH
ncbi:MAG: PDZ domain-containing protein, partial [Acidobacteriota bacterium]